MKIAFLFSGQGSQFVGMGKNLSKNKIAHKTYWNAQEISGISILEISQNSSKEQLQESQNIQLAIITLQAAILNIIKAADVKSDATAGLSLGEYSALYNAGAFSFKEMITLVKARGEIMEAFSKKLPGAKMMVVLGLEAKQTKKYVEQLYNQKYAIAVANYNCPQQQVIYGTTKALKVFKEIATDVKRLLPIDVAVPSHTPFMEPIVEEFKTEINKVKFKKLNQDFYANITGKKMISDQVKDGLISQLTNSTHIEKIITNMIDTNVEVFVEIGPKKVLSSFVKKIAQKFDKEVKILNAFDLESTQEVINYIKEI